MTVQFRKYITTYIVIIAILASFGIGILIGRKMQKPQEVSGVEIVNKNGKKIEEVDFGLFWNVFDLIEKKHYDRPIDQKKLFYGAISGMVKAIDDPYSAFMDPETTKKFEEELEGTFEGIGVEIGIKKNRLTVISPLEGTPAQKAGLKPGDWIVKINDDVTIDMNLDEAVQKIRGEKGTKVKLTISRDNLSDPQEFEIARNTITVKTVKLEFLENDIAHLEVLEFGNDTKKELDKAVMEILTKNTRGIILDLRNNPGGLLDVSVKVAGQFIPEGTIVIEQYADGKREILESEGPGKLKDIPTVILVNEGSASASEIVAGAMHDRLGTKLIGMKTFGKGSVQDLETLPQGTSLRITTAKWLTPNGDEIDEKGLNPDIEIDLTDEDYDNNRDPQLDKAREEIQLKLSSLVYTNLHNPRQIAKELAKIF
ncbi:MAG: hypothetical protein ACD_63C00041G0005 [uncultured bacterium]|nr:MAG: hypothetical protein ACD_63C00041G0005 [uncultured bacterium]